MFITKSRHNSEIRFLTLSSEQREAMYQNQIRLLEDRISDLRSLVFSPIKPSDVPPVMLEADKILSPNDDSPIVESTKESEAILREQNLIFSGEYEEGLNESV